MASPQLIFGTCVAGVSATLNLQASTVGTGANTTETTLFTYTLPANTLDAVTKGIRVKTFGTMANNAHVKTVKLYFGSAPLTLDLTPSVAGSWCADLLVIGTASAQKAQCSGNMVDSATGVPLSIFIAGAATEDGTAAIIIKTTGTNGTATANDIVGLGFAVELLSTPA